MQNYKVEVQNHSEGMEAQDLFLELGFKKSTLLEDGYPKYVVADQVSLTGGKESGGAHISFVGTNYKKITLPELRAMVSVQKYEELAKKYDGVKTKQLPNGIQFKKSKTSVTIYPSTGTIVSDVCGKINVLKNAGIGKLDHEMNKHFSVITPKQKEYLVKTDTGYTLQVLSDVVDGHDGIIEVPKDAMSYWECNKHNVKFFSKTEKGSHFHHYLNKNSKWALWDDADFKTFEIKWQRESLNDQVASAEEYRQSFAKQNGIPIFLERQKFTQPEELPFIGDELKGVDATLAEREAQYGSFIGVANTTGQLMSVLLNSKNGQTLPYAHQEALHMICSKMARIVNGDHNHLDSWHDIGGYAKLIENNIK